MKHAPRPFLPLALTTLVAIALVAACSSGGATGSLAPSDAPPASPSAAAGEIEHPTGATDVILRYEDTGGFVPVEFLATSVPHFTLYGDGSIVFRDPATEWPEPQGSVRTAPPLRTAKLSEEQVQELLTYALSDGGLAAARDTYRNDMIADASTAVFTIDAGGVQKVVSVYALGLDPELDPNVADGPARAAFSALAERLTTIDQGGTIPTEVYVPSAYRGVLIDSPGAVAPDAKPWPWPDLTPADFAPAADAALQFPHRVMTADDLAALGVNDYEGGFQGMILTGDDGKTYSFSLRPLLPEEVTG